MKYFFIIWIWIMIWIMNWMMIFSFYFDISKVALHPIHPLRNGAIGTGDYDKDGLMDFFSGGESAIGSSAYLYRQNTSLTFYDVTNGVTFPGGLPAGFSAGLAILADINKDGAVDLFYAGYGITSSYFQVGASNTFYLNNSAFLPAGLIPAYLVSGDLGDY